MSKDIVARLCDDPVNVKGQSGLIIFGLNFAPLVI